MKQTNGFKLSNKDNIFIEGAQTNGTQTNATKDNIFIEGLEYI